MGVLTVESMEVSMHKKWSLPLGISSVNATKSDLLTFTEETINRKLHFLCSMSSVNNVGLHLSAYQINHWFMLGIQAHQVKNLGVHQHWS